MADPRSHIRGVEVYRIPLVDLWQTWVSPLGHCPFLLLMTTGPDLIAGSGKSIYWQV